LFQQKLGDGGHKPIVEAVRQVIGHEYQGLGKGAHSVPGLGARGADGLHNLASCSVRTVAGVVDKDIDAALFGVDSLVYLNDGTVIGEIEGPFCGVSSILVVSVTHS
jgi:hypothetical protein